MIRHPRQRRAVAFPSRNPGASLAGAVRLANPQRDPSLLTRVRRGLERLPDGVILGDWPVRRTAAAIPAARRQVRNLAARVPGCAEISADVELMAGELLANAVEHGGGDEIWIRVSMAGPVVRVEVRDAGCRSPQPSPACGPLDERGRGLMLVSALSRAWGLGHDGDGTTAWFDCVAGPPR